MQPTETTSKNVLENDLQGEVKTHHYSTVISTLRNTKPISSQHSISQQTNNKILCKRQCVRMIPENNLVVVHTVALLYYYIIIIFFFILLLLLIIKSPCQTHQYLMARYSKILCKRQCVRMIPEYNLVDVTATQPHSSQ